MNRIIMRSLQFIVIATLLAGPVQQALAQQMTIEPPTGEKPIFQWIFLIVLSGLCVGIAFKNPKRGHQG